MPYKTGIAKDVAENVWSFITPASPVNLGEVQTASDALDQFYTYSWAAGKLTDYLSQALSNAAAAVTHTCYLPSIDSTTGKYHLGAPIAEHTYTLPAQTTPTISGPGQVALAVSYHSTTSGIPEHGPGKTRPKARRRGRMFIGPFGVNVLTDSGSPSHSPVPNQQLVTILQQAASGLLSNLATYGIQWAVNSIVDKVFRQTTGGWIDNAWDIQRRRQEAPTVKTTFGSLSRAALEIVESPTPVA
jgi:hypothetical protein